MCLSYVWGPSLPLPPCSPCSLPSPVSRGDAWSLLSWWPHWLSLCSWERCCLFPWSCWLGSALHCSFWLRSSWHCWHWSGMHGSFQKEAVIWNHWQFQVFIPNLNWDMLKDMKHWTHFNVVMMLLPWCRKNKKIIQLKRKNKDKKVMWIFLKEENSAEATKVLV